MSEFSIGVEQLHVFQTASGMLVPVGEAAPSVTNQAGGTGISTVFNLLEVGFRLFLGIVAVAAGYYFAMAGLKFMRAANDPQMLAQARMQVVFTGVGLVMALSAQLAVGTVVDFVSGASGGAIVDIGDVADLESQTAKTLPAGSFLGLYGGRALLCPQASSSQADGDAAIAVGGPAASAAWQFVATSGSVLGHCQEITP